MNIEDGEGTGSLVGVDTHRLKTSSRNNPRIWYESVEHGQAFTWSNATYDYDAADTILAVQNDSATKLLHIYQIHIEGDTETAFTIHCPKNVTMAGTAVTGVNLNRTSANVADATAKADETGNSQANVIYRSLMLAKTKQIIEIPGLVLGKNDVIAVDFTTDGGAALVDIVGYFI